MAIDITTDIGKVRFKIGDTTDIPFLPDSVIDDSLTKYNGNLSRASSECAMYILAQLSFNTHRKMAQLEVWGKESFSSYKEFLNMLVKDPNFSGTCPIPYCAGTEVVNPLIGFVSDWQSNYSGGTQSDLLHQQAIWDDQFTKGIVP